jgi:hypothetical protein
MPVTMLLLTMTHISVLDFIYVNAVNFKCFFFSLFNQHSRIIYCLLFLLSCYYIVGFSIFCAEKETFISVCREIVPILQIIVFFLCIVSLWVVVQSKLEFCLKLYLFKFVPWVV